MYLQGLGDGKQLIPGQDAPKRSACNRFRGVGVRLEGEVANLFDQRPGVRRLTLEGLDLIRIERWPYLKSESPRFVEGGLVRETLAYLVEIEQFQSGFTEVFQ